jgi:3-deoxy-manno-octulosonate cytidylyltransferase (CMP-KDO synthetase)
MPSSSVTIVIPARYASVRFPAKMLASETGKPLVQHVFEAAVGARCARPENSGRVVIATDDERIAAAARKFGAPVVMTSPGHPNGTSRLAETAEALGLGDDAIVVNAQGDEPELDPGLIDVAVDTLRASSAPMSTVASPLSPGDDPRDPNMVKCVRRLDGLAIYFSRSLIPFDRDGAGLPESRPLKHIGLYAYRRPFLRTYVTLAETPLERVEKLEQLRVLENGHAIAVGVAPSNQSGIDTPEQYAAFVRRWRSGSRA